MTGFDFEIEDKLKTLSEIEKEIRRQVEERLSNYELTMVIYALKRSPTRQITDFEDSSPTKLKAVHRQHRIFPLLG